MKDEQVKDFIADLKYAFTKEELEQIKRELEQEDDDEVDIDGDEGATS